MSVIEIDLLGDDDVVTINPQHDKDEKARQEETKRKVLEELFRRAPQPQVVPVGS